MNAPPIQNLSTRRFTISRLDHIRAALGGSFVRIMITFVAVVAYSIYRGYERGNLDWTRVFISMSFSLIIYFFLLLLLFVGVLIRIGRRGDDHFVTPQAYQFSDVGVYLQTPNRPDAYLDWQGFRYVVRRGRYVVMCLASNDLIVIPRNAFSSEADEKAFFDMVIRRGVKRLYQ